MKYFFLLSAILFFIATGLAQVNKAEDLVSKMTLEEKARLVVGMGMNIPGLTQNRGPVIGQTLDKVQGAAGTTYAIQRLGLPNTVVADGPAGLRIDPIRGNDSSKTYYATAWPVATLLASTWDTKLVGEVGQAMGNEIKEYGVDVILGPALNIHRNPLGGRNFEYYSEDPLVSGKMTAAMVNGIQSNGVGTSIKHFAANNQETNRNSINTHVSERALREIYLRGFQIGVREAQPWTVMSSYNQINGKYASEDHDLLTTILRKEWGFKGLVMTDWFGGQDAVAQMQAGNDLLMPGTPAQSKTILEAVQSGKLDEKILNENAERMVSYIFKTPSYRKQAHSDKPDLKAHAQLVRKAAAEGMILLKNKDQVLPLVHAKKLAAFGNTSYAFIAGGTGSGDVNEAYTVSLVEGLSNAGYQLDQEVKKLYTDHLDDYNKKHPKKDFFQEFMNPTPPAPELAPGNDLIARKADQTEAAIITIGRNAGEGRDRDKDKDFNLSEIEKSLIKNVSAAFHAKGKKVIVIINTGGVIEAVSWRDEVDAILLAWQGGQEAGNAVADILKGKVNPSGRLATTFPVNYEDEPSAKNFPGTENPDKKVPGMMGMMINAADVTYEEGIYVGYRYYSTFNVKPAYEFGYGLSYTDFEFSNLNLSSSTMNDQITASVTVTNKGKTAGKEVVQLYVTAPSQRLDKPSLELKGFAKTGVIQPGQSETVKFTITPADLASFHTDASAWIAESGNYTIKIGSSSVNIRLTTDFSLPRDITTEKCHPVMVPQALIRELKNQF